MTKLTPIQIDPDKFLYEHSSLPELPSFLNKLQQMIHSSKVSALEVTKLICTDAPMVAQILKVVNSAYFCISREITDLKIAIAYLGLNEINRIALNLSIINLLVDKDKKAFKEIWFHSVFTAICANYLARKFAPKLNFMELWSAAILHDIGKFVYLKFFPEHYQELRNYSLEKGCLFCDAEKFYSLPSSAYLGTLLCDRWRLPQNVKAVCSSHTFYDLLNKKDQDFEETFIPIVALANLLALFIINPLNSDLENRITKTIIQHLDITDSEFDTLRKDMKRLKKEAEMFTSIQLR
jgi:HD-like signal output (HDOD) protein